MVDVGVRVRLGLLLALLVAVLAGVGAYSVGHVRQAHATLTTVFEDRVVPLRQLQRLAQAHAQTGLVVQQLRDGLLDPDQATQQLQAAGEASRREWAAYLATYLVPDEQALIERTRPLLARSEAARERVVMLLRARDRSGLAAYAAETLPAETQPLAQALGHLQDLQVIVAQRELEASQRVYDLALLRTAIAVLLALVAGVSLVVWVAVRYSREQAAAQHAKQRQADFYAALSHTNQLIVRVRDAQVLYDETCRICVNAGHATLACIWRFDAAAGHLVLLASSGPTLHYLGAASSEVSEVSEPDGPVLGAWHSGQSAVADECHATTFSDPAHRHAQAKGVCGVAAFPIRRGGGVAAVLTLYVRESGFFDAPLRALMDEMAGDLSFALDSIDRDAAHDAAQRALADSESRLHGILESALDAILSIDSRRVVVQFNQAAARMLRVEAQDVIGTSVDRFVPPERLAQDHRSFDEYLRGLREPPVLPTRMVVVRADGERFWSDLTLSLSGTGERLVMTLVFSDVTELLEAEQAREDRRAAEAASRAKTEFLSRMSHELRTPLNAVLGFSQILQNDEANPLAPSQRGQVEAIRQAGWHLLSLINDVLDISRIESGHMQVQPRRVRLEPAVAEVVALVRAQAEAASVALEVEPFEAPSLEAWCDPLRLRQVLLNLLSNAVKYNRPGGRVQVSAQGGEPLICLRVSDTGQGMSADQLDHLFEPFNRLGREHGPVEGTGIGMAIARQLIELMDGDIEVESREGEGTTVRVRLPTADAHDGPPSEAAPLMDASAAAADNEPQGTVLYIEDNAVNVIVVEQMLARWRLVKLVHAENGHQGLELARRIHPELVLLDMHLPDMDGPEVLRTLQGDTATDSLRVVALSASALDDEVKEARALGAFDYWTKPLDFERFLDSVRRLLVTSD